jgi:hypothetical protein
MGADKKKEKNKEAEAAAIAAQHAAAIEAGYQLGPEELYRLTSTKDTAKLDEIGGPAGLAKAIKSDIKTGISTSEQDNEERTRMCVFWPSSRFFFSLESIRFCSPSTSRKRQPPESCQYISLFCISIQTISLPYSRRVTLSFRRFSFLTPTFSLSNPVMVITLSLSHLPRASSSCGCRPSRTQPSSSSPLLPRSPSS